MSAEPAPDPPALSERQALAHLRRATQAHAAAKPRLDHAIRTALASGVPATRIAKITGLTTPRIYQIKASVPAQSPAPTSRGS